jgi:ADP-heptose:LPS heptosyltransferase
MSHPKKILIVRFSSIGDIVLTSPVVRCIQKTYPDAEIHFLTKPSFTCLINKNPHIHKIIKLDGNIISTSLKLRKERYDLIVDLHKNLRTFILKGILFKKSISYNKLNIQKWLTTKLPWNFLPYNHIVHRYFKSLKKINVSYDNQGLDFYYSEEGRDFALDILNKEGITQPYLLITVGAKFATKAMSTRKIAEIIESVDHPVVLIGDNSDRDKAFEIQSLTDKPIFNACGRFTLEQSAVLVDHAAMVVAHDTGFMHIASAFKKPLISVWGNTITKFGMYPLYPQGEEIRSHVVEVKELKCRPCSKLGYDTCPKKHFKCMNDIDIQKINGIIKKTMPLTL